MKYLISGVYDGFVRVMEYACVKGAVERVGEYDLEDVRGKSVYFIPSFDMEFSKMVMVPRVVRRKQAQIVRQQMKEEVPQAEDFLSRYVVLGEDKLQQEVYLSIVKKRQLEEQLEQFKDKGVYVEGVVPGNIIPLLAGGLRRFSWGDAVYFTEYKDAGHHLRKVSLAEEQGEGEDLGALVSGYLNKHKKLPIDLLPEEMTYLKSYRKHKYCLHGSVVLAVLAGVMGGQYFYRGAELYDAEASKLELLIDEAERKLEYYYAIEKEYDNRRERFDLIGGMIEAPLTYGGLFQELEEITPAEIVLRDLVNKGGSGELELKGVSASGDYKEMESYIEGLGKIDGLGEVLQMDSKKMDGEGLEFAVKFRVKGEYL